MVSNYNFKAHLSLAPAAALGLSIGILAWIISSAVGLVFMFSPSFMTDMEYED